MAASLEILNSISIAKTWNLVLLTVGFSLIFSLIKHICAECILWACTIIKPGASVKITPVNTKITSRLEENRKYYVVTWFNIPSPSCQSCCSQQIAHPRGKGYPKSGSIQPLAGRLYQKGILSDYSSCQEESLRWWLLILLMKTSYDRPTLLSI